MRGAAVGGGAVVATGATVTALEFAGAPWWVIALVVSVMLIVGGGVTLVQTVIPQESSDRLAWWQDRRAHQERLRNSATRIPRARRSPNTQNPGGRRHTPTQASRS
jgi:cell division protein FtsW (lipid II flippase)